MRRPAPQDADALFAIYSHPEVMRYWSRRPLVTRDEAVAMLENMVTGLADGTWQSWAVTRQGDDTPIGVCSLFNFVTGCRRAELGYILARASWGQGVMTEALGSVIAHAFGPLGLRRLEADADPRNAGSLRLLTRLGFVREGTLRARWEIDGEISDTAFYGLLKGDWLARRATDGDATTGR